MPAWPIASAAIVVAFFAPLQAVAACPIFSPPMGFTAGSGPTSIAAGDFNRDGNMDLAVANYGSHDISILLGIGDGKFVLPAPPYKTGLHSSLGVVAGDLNRDGKSDLAVVSYNANANGIVLFRGIGDGTFVPLGTYLRQQHPNGVAIGDFNGDSKNDLAVSKGDISILNGDGSGKFVMASAYPADKTSTPPRALAIADFNRDGNDDIAVANSGTISILIGAAGGSFLQAVNYPVGTNLLAITSGDVNGDSRTDLVVARAGFNSVAVLLGDSKGAFGTASNYSVGTTPASVAIADFDRDGKSDIAVANQGSNSVSVLRGDGKGGFNTVLTYTGLSVPTSVVVADFNKDGKMDLAVANSGSMTVSIFLNACTCP